MIVARGLGRGPGRGALVAFGLVLWSVQPEIPVGGTARPAPRRIRPRWKDEEELWLLTISQMIAAGIIH